MQEYHPTASLKKKTKLSDCFWKSISQKPMNSTLKYNLLAARPLPSEALL